jgi:hypothetical protein
MLEYIPFKDFGGREAEHSIFLLNGKEKFITRALWAPTSLRLNDGFYAALA